ncbi:MAG TPA: DHH family phosphoesterase [Thermoplasmata archaeon]|nr:DHH family phosphoesterase [Thermoplasmata archaeon]
MASGPEAFVRHARYGQEFAKARGLVLGNPRRWRVIYHYDGDGVAAASALLRAFSRLGYPAQATALFGVERERFAALARSTPGPLIVTDTGSSWLDLYPEHPHPVVVLDHHRYPGAPEPPALPPHVAFVNPIDWEVDGMNELSASSLSWLFTIFLDPANWDNAPWGLSGAIHDRQHVGGFRGLNATLAEEAHRRALLERRRGLALFGRSLTVALAESVDPFVRGLSGRPDAAERFVRDLGLDPARRPTELSPPEAERLARAVQHRLESDQVLPEFVSMLDGERWFVPSLGLDAEEVSNLQNATGRAGIPGVGVAYALGDPGAAEKARSTEADWRTGILRGLRRIEDGGVHSMEALRWFESPETPLAGTQAGLAMNYLLPSDLPVFVFSDGGEQPTKVSARGLVRQVERGLDLASVCRKAAAEVGGEGGGHRVASGATIPPGSRDRFLAAANRELGDQLAHRGLSA